MAGPAVRTFRPYKSASQFSNPIHFDIADIFRPCPQPHEYEGYFNYRQDREFAAHLSTVGRLVLSLRPSAGFSSFVAQLGNAAQINLALPTGTPSKLIY